MNFATTNVTYRQLLGNGLSYRVPRFQRDYSWTETEWDDLWQDMENLFEPDGEPAHYMGYLVLQSSNNRQFDLIDGQQRMTTLSLLVLAAMKHLQSLVDEGLDVENNTQRAEQLRASYIGYLDLATLVPQSKLQLNRHNDYLYQKYLVPLQSIPSRGLKASEHLLRKAFGWFHQKIASRCGSGEDSGSAAATFIDALVDKIVFTTITVTDQLNAFKVFETLNARGVRLSATDLLKNYLFSVVSASGDHEAELSAVEEHWEHVLGQLGSENFPEFLRIFWNSRNTLVRKADLFKTISRNVTTKEAAFKLLRDLEMSAAAFVALRDPYDSSWEPPERKALEDLQLFNVRQPLSMLLACYDCFFESDRSAYARVLRAVATISFRYNVICNLFPQDQERLYNAIARKVADGTYKTAQDVIAAMRPMYPDDSAFKVAFASKELTTTNTRNKKIARYILFAIEKQTSGQDMAADNAAYTLEHILPEHPTAEWSEAIEQPRQAALVYRLGNLILLEAAANRDLGNAAYPPKRKAYAKSKFQITKDLAERHEEWTSGTIHSRQERLAATATAIWRLNFPA